MGRADINTDYDFQACWWSISGSEKGWLPRFSHKSQSYAWAINAHHEVVGVYGDNIDATLGKTLPNGNPAPKDRYACYWESTSKPGKRLFQGQEQGFAMGINDDSEIVGSFVPDPMNPTQTHAFYYTHSGGRQDLNDLIYPSSIDPTRPIWTLTEARGINNHGEIVGVGSIAGENHAVLLTPSVPRPFPRKNYEILAPILGVINDAGGVAWIGGHPVPVPPMGPEMDILLGVASHRIASLMADPEGRKIERAAMNFVRDIALKEIRRLDAPAGGG